MNAAFMSYGTEATCPDHGNGSAEWLAVLALAVVTAALAVGARHEWRRAHRVIRTA